MNRYLIIFLLITLFACTSKEKNVSSINIPKTMDTATFGTGCFWCTEAIFKSIKGVYSVFPGYCGGQLKNPTYEDVCSGTTGHAEVVQIAFDKEQVSFEKLLEVFFQVHNPTSLNKQGADAGTQYRSVIFWHNEEQKNTSLDIINKLNESGAYERKIVTEIAKFETFYQAENYHLDYYAKNPRQGYCTVVIGPKVEKFQKVFKNILK